MCPDDEILVVDASDEAVPPGAMGALLTRGPYTPRGYYRAAEHNARAFTPDGWYRTGDVVRLHPSGNLVVEGRDKDLIHRGGEKISAEEVENLIYRLPGVARLAAVAKADPDLGERVYAVVVVEPGTHLSLESVRAALTGMQVARYKLPEVLPAVDELPLTKVGKIDKKRLRMSSVARQTPSRRCDDARRGGERADGVAVTLPLPRGSQTALPAFWRYLGNQLQVPPSPSTRPDRRTSSGMCPVLVTSDMRPRVRPAAESFSARTRPSASSTGRSVRGNRSASSARARG
ncbi:hypothetical protein AB0929_02175 [Streptomyces massasporeus]|uniref:AMP-binding enzyme n=1 Tax=Streptomyces massasporeus TaxID=67324 RepID=UPI003453C14B